jgi:type II secretory pathway predicted ATPase ExeA
MAAQLELENKLRDPSKRAIKSRIFLPSILSPLSLPEARDMIAFRCEQSFVPNPFDDDAVKAIYDASEGVPRDILKIANAAYVLMKGSGLSSVPAESIPSVVLEAKLRD